MAGWPSCGSSYAHYSDISHRRANRSDRDKLDDDDSVTIYLEPFQIYETPGNPRVETRRIGRLKFDLYRNSHVGLIVTRVNSGTVFYVGCDDRFRQGNAINDSVFTGTAYQRTNRAVFTKLQYLFRNGGDN